LFFDLKDRLMMLPVLCEYSQGLKLKSCLEEKIKNVTLDLRDEYQLSLTIEGIDIETFIEDGLQRILEEPNLNNALNNSEDFTEQFYANLGVFETEYRTEFGIGELKEIDGLENDLAILIEKARANEQLGQKDQVLLDEIDRALYAFFLNLRQDFYLQAPLERNRMAVEEINSLLFAELKKFYRENKIRLSDVFVKLMKKLAKIGR
jgi:hypothetical protein